MDYIRAIERQQIRLLFVLVTMSRFTIASLRVTVPVNRFSRAISFVFLVPALVKLLRFARSALVLVLSAPSRFTAPRLLSLRLFVMVLYTALNCTSFAIALVRQLVFVSSASFRSNWFMIKPSVWAAFCMAGEYGGI